jgi:hypothetical protein
MTRAKRLTKETDLRANSISHGHKTPLGGIEQIKAIFFMILLGFLCVLHAAPHAQAEIRVVDLTLTVDEELVDIPYIQEGDVTLGQIEFDDSSLTGHDFEYVDLEKDTTPIEFAIGNVFVDHSAIGYRFDYGQLHFQDGTLVKIYVDCSFIYEGRESRLTTGPFGHEFNWGVNQHAAWISFDYDFTINDPDPQTVEEFLSDNVVTAILGLPDDAFKHNASNRKHALENKIQAVVNIVTAARADADPVIRNELLQEATDELQGNGILGKLDGCYGGDPENDWISDCDAQAIVYPLVMNASSMLSDLM